MADARLAVDRAGSKRASSAGRFPLGARRRSARGAWWRLGPSDSMLDRSEELRIVPNDRAGESWSCSRG